MDIRRDRSARSWAVAILLGAVLTTGVADADQTDARLGTLFSELKSTDRPDQAQEIERQIWAIWLYNEEAELNGLMSEGVGAMSMGRIDEAIRIFDRIVERAPDFAEGWNKRATAYYLVDRLAESVRDIRRTLALEPRHFGAISGMGLIFLQQGDERGALSAFEQVLEINPNAVGAQIRVEELRRKLQGRGV